MNAISRRSFLELSARLGAVMGLGACAVPRIASALEEMAAGTAPVLWLQGQCCSGCSVALLDAEAISPYRLLTRYISLTFHQTLSTATGHVAVDTVNKTISQGGYLLVVEGSVPAGMPHACTFGEEKFGSQLERAAKNAKAIVALGACAAFGGIPAAGNNPTGASSIPDYLVQQGINTATIRIPGCPAHPDGCWGADACAQVRPAAGWTPWAPKAFFSRLLHDECPRFADYEREKFARTFGEEGCFFKLGCLGPNTHADCNLRQWNGGTNTCIRAGAPCIGCAEPGFALKADFPFFTKNRAAQSTPPKS